MAIKGGKVLRTATAAARKFRLKQLSGTPSASPATRPASLATAPVTPSSGVGKFLGVPETPRSDVDILISKYIRLSQNRLTKKGEFSEEKLKRMFCGGGEEKMIGINETMKLLEGRATLAGIGSSKAPGNVRSIRKKK